MRIVEGKRLQHGEACPSRVCALEFVRALSVEDLHCWIRLGAKGRDSTASRTM